MRAAAEVHGLELTDRQAEEAARLHLERWQEARCRRLQGIQGRLRDMLKPRARGHQDNAAPIAGLAFGPFLEIGGKHSL